MGFDPLKNFPEMVAAFTRDWMAEARGYPEFDHLTDEELEREGIKYLLNELQKDNRIALH